MFARPPDLPLGFALVEVTRLLRREIARAVEQAGLGLTAGEARALAYIDQYRGLRQGALAERMGLEPMTLVGYLDRLEARGYVRRRPHPEDRRAKTVVLTEKAVPALAEFEAVTRAVRRAARQGLSPAEIDVLRRALAVMRENLNRGGEPA